MLAMRASAGEHSRRLLLCVTGFSDDIFAGTFQNRTISICHRRECSIVDNTRTGRRGQYAGRREEGTTRAEAALITVDAGKRPKEEKHQKRKNRQADCSPQAGDNSPRWEFGEGGGLTATVQWQFFLCSHPQFHLHCKSRALLC